MGVLLVGCVGGWEVGERVDANVLQAPMLPSSKMRLGRERPLG